MLSTYCYNGSVAINVEEPSQLFDVLQHFLCFKQFDFNRLLPFPALGDRKNRLIGDIFAVHVQLTRLS